MLWKIKIYDLKNKINYLIRGISKKIYFFKNIFILKNNTFITIFIYNGIFFKKFFFTKLFINYKLGYFIFTKKRFKFNKKIKKKR